MSKILIVDDEHDVCDVLKETLEYEGFEVHTAYTGDEAMRLTNTGVYDAMIVDLRLEGSISGVDVVRHFNHQGSRPKILISSGTPKALIHSLFEREGIVGLVDGVLEKPGDLNPDFVTAAIRKVLQHS